MLTYFPESKPYSNPRRVGKYIKRVHSAIRLFHNCLSLELVYKQHITTKYRNRTELSSNSLKHSAIGRKENENNWLAPWDFHSGKKTFKSSSLFLCISFSVVSLKQNEISKSTK